MSAMNDLDIYLQDAGDQIEDAAHRLRVALDALGVEKGNPGEIRAAFADLYDAGIDTVLTMRGVYDRPKLSVPS